MKKEGNLRSMNKK